MPRPIPSHCLPDCGEKECYRPPKPIRSLGVAISEGMDQMYKMRVRDAEAEENWERRYGR